MADSKRMADAKTIIFELDGRSITPPGRKKAYRLRGDNGLWRYSIYWEIAKAGKDGSPTQEIKNRFKIDKITKLSDILKGVQKEIADLFIVRKDRRWGCLHPARKRRPDERR